MNTKTSRPNPNMKFDPNKHRRKSIRVPGYDYSQSGAYFVTMVTYRRECMFGDVVDGEMRLNDFGKIAKGYWHEIPNHFPNVKLGTHMVMPNHVHGIIIIIDSHVGARHASPLHDDKTYPHGFKPGSLGAIVGSYKSAVTKRINEIDNSPGAVEWQRNYYACPERSRREHIIQNDREWNNIHLYIESNPLNWATDEENPICHAQ